MNFFTLAAVLLFTGHSLASGGDAAIKSLGEIYEKKTGTCASSVDIMPWYNYDLTGLVSIALTDHPGVRPMDNAVHVISLRSETLLPSGQGTFNQFPHQPVPMKTEYSYLRTGELVLNFYQKGKGSMGGLFAGQPYPKEHRKIDLVFSGRNAENIFQDLELTYQDLKGLRPTKKVVCTYSVR